MRRSFLKKIYIAKRLERTVDDNGHYIERYDKPVEYMMNVQPMNAGLEMEAYGTKAMQMQKAICRYADFKDMFTENDVAYLDGASPDGEEVHGMNANYRIEAVLNQNKCIAIYFERRAGK